MIELESDRVRLTGPLESGEFVDTEVLQIEPDDDCQQQEDHEDPQDHAALVVGRLGGGDVVNAATKGDEDQASHHVREDQ